MGKAKKETSKSTTPTATAYEVAIEKIFFKYYKRGDVEVQFRKSDIDDVADDEEVKAANSGKKLSNPPALVYEFRSRRALPPAIAKTANEGFEWGIELDGKSRYVFKQMRGMLIEPRPDMAAIPIPDATPEIVEQYALDDEQALLAKIRYNRLIDIFLCIATYSLQNHLRTSAEMRPEKGSRSQIEIDEIYVGVDKKGQHYVIPVQAKGGKDKLSKMQSRQDIAWCKQRLPELECRAISAQFVGDEIVLFLLKEEGEDIKVEEEKRYKLFRSDKSEVPNGRRS
ncbi:hypothetical protein EV678_0213 [Azospira oryzae]|uniref:Endonuclease n=1 Tax=Azospira oryzae TaxID=146939 RepID=A0ABY0IPD4_9RHOO|nr:hypothetical protein [Azospira oryzae]RZT89428.1 hypothetical protein EV678_0213 [Azospira oryzae]